VYQFVLRAFIFLLFFFLPYQAVKGYEPNSAVSENHYSRLTTHYWWEWFVPITLREACFAPRGNLHLQQVQKHQ
jgi:hypothetical protein